MTGHSLVAPGHGLVAGLAALADEGRAKMAET
jgi:hypothetical protein